MSIQESPIAGEKPAPNIRFKFLIGGLLIVAAVIYLIVSSTRATAQYYVSINELLAETGIDLECDFRVSGVVDGDTIAYDPQSMRLSFIMANIPSEMDEIEDLGGLAAVLHRAVSDPSVNRLPVVYIGLKPDMLRHEAQAIVTGRMGNDGVFYADQLLLKCPSRYEEEIPLQMDRK